MITGEHTLQADINESFRTLQSGGIILYPTDTIWGIGCDATNAGAVKRIFDLKKREEKKSMIILVSGISMIEQYVHEPSPALTGYILSASRPTTAVFKNAQNLASNLINEDGSVAIRVVKETFCRSLLEKSGKPLVSTSANLSGEPSPQNFSDVSEVIRKGVDYIVTYRQNEDTKKSPSAIITLDGEGQIVFIRK